MILNYKNPISLGVIFAVLLSISLLQFKTYDIKNNTNPFPISWDVYGYYLYLPATFIYDDLGLQNNEWISKTREKYKPSSTFYQAAQGEGNKKIIVYNIGYSIIYAPGFFIANALAPSLGYEKDGFSKPYQISLLITALMFTIIGLLLFRKISLNYFSDKVTAIIILITIVGTNYFFQSTFDGVMPHNLLFTLNCFIIWFTIKWHKDRTLKNISILAFFIGFATICRPTELLWVLVPLFWNVTNKELFLEKISFLFKNYIQLLSSFLIVLGLVFIQLFYNKYAAGNFLVVNLHSEGFSFLSPYTLDFLFSYKKGWLVYTPIMMLGIIGFYYLYKIENKLFLSLFLFLFFHIYVASSWECWWYATSFSQRPMVESYAMMLFPIGYFIVGIQNQKKWIYRSAIVIIILLIIFNLFQTWQFKKGIIDGERMTKSYYWKVFGSAENNDENKKYLSVDRYQAVFSEYDFYRNNYFKKELLFNDFENEQDNFVDTLAISGKSYLLSEQNPYSPGFEQKYIDLTNKNFMWIRASVWVYLTVPYSESNSCIVISTETKGKSYKYLSSNYDNFNVKPNVWTEIHLDYLTPDIRHNDDKVKIYFWNMGKSPVLIDNFKVDSFEPKENIE